MCSIDLAERLEGSDVVSNALHPGKLALEGWGGTIDSLRTGVDAVMRLTTDEPAAIVNGRFLDRQRRGRPMPQADDADARRRLRALSERRVAQAWRSRIRRR
jgi:hypothetical protein